MRILAEELNLDATLDSGQVFGFVRFPKSGRYEGVVAGRRLAFIPVDGGTEVRVADDGPETPEARVREFFDLDRDLAPVYEILRRDPRLVPALERYRGLRVVHQEAWEALASFIISANNHQKRIQLIWRSLAARLGPCPDIFPAFGPVARSCESELRALGLGYRAPYLLEAARLVEANPERFYAIRSLDYADAKEAVRQYPGAGDKVADCVLLFGFQKMAAFPVDTWISKIMRRLYFSGRRAADRRVCEYAQRKWGEFAGYIQQYVFHAARNGILSAALVAVAASSVRAEAPDGTAKDYYDNGRIKSETSYRDNLPDGRYRLYSENGVMVEEGVNAAGKLDGIVKRYDDKGQIEMEGEYRAGELHGTVRKFGPLGVPAKAWTYRHGVRHGPAETYYSNGTILEEADYADDQIQGMLKRYFESGALQEEVVFKDGAADGPSRSFYEDGSVQAERTYKADRIEGPCRLFAKNGKILAEVYYRSGAMDGTARFFDEEGRLVREEHYRSGARVDSR